MIKRAILMALLITFLFCGVALANDRWIYSTAGGAYYAVANEPPLFTWSGGVVDGRLDGYGVQEFYRDSLKVGVYEGNMVEGYRQGYGVLNWNDLRYAGEWFQSRYHGRGHLIRAGGQYLGDFRHGKMDGYGVYVGDGFLRTGQFAAGRYLGMDIRPGYFVIGLCSPSRLDAEAEVTKHKALGLHAMVVYSSDWSNLGPGLYIVVYGMLPSEEEVNLLKGFEFIHHIPYYIKYSGDQR